MSKHTKEPWAQGITLLTHETRKWTAEQIEESNQVERRTIFSEFTPVDEGRSRKLVVVCDREEDARRIVACVNACREIPTDDLEESLFTILEYMEDQYAEKIGELLAALKLANENLRACQAAIHLDGGFDPAYVRDAQAAMKVAGACIAKVEGGAI